jgi:tRNA/tmRNA/rRNA uracil-C5-methylase (TrmA/RlmC/RlmD family)
MRADGPVVTATIVDLTHDGVGVADLDGRKIFVADALPGERVEIALRKRRRKMQEAELKRVLEPSPSRVAPECEYFGRCGGCALQHLQHTAQVPFKQQVVAGALKRIGNVEPHEWLPSSARRGTIAGARGSASSTSPARTACSSVFASARGRISRTCGIARC